MTLCYDFKTSAIQTPALFDDLTTFTLIPYLDEYNQNCNIETAVKNAMKELEDLNVHEDSKPILLGYVSEQKLYITNQNYTDHHEIKVIEKFIKGLTIKIEEGEEPLVFYPQFVLFKCFPYCIDLPLQYGYIVNKYTEVVKYNMYLLDKYQFVLVTELEFDFEENDILTDDFLEKLVSK